MYHVVGVCFSGGLLRWQRICLQCRRPRFDPWVGKLSWRRESQPTSVFQPGEFHGQRRLAVYSPWVESDMTEEVVRARAHTHTHTHTHRINKLLYIKQISNKDILQNRKLQSLSCNKLYWSTICKNTESLCHTPETNVIW